MKLSYLKGLSFGLTSGVITTLGLMVGLKSGTESTLAVIGGILTVAIADAFSDALGIHISEKSQGIHSKMTIWESTFATFMGKMFFGLSFLIPVILFDLQTAVYVSIVWGFFALGVISYYMALEQKMVVWKLIAEHWGLTAFVITLTHFVGIWIKTTFGGM